MKKSIFLLFAAFATLLVGCQREEIDGEQGLGIGIVQEDENEDEEEEEDDDEEGSTIEIKIDDMLYLLNLKKKTAVLQENLRQSSPLS